MGVLIVLVSNSGSGNLPLPDEFELVKKVADERPDVLTNSCQKDGGIGRWALNR